MDTRIHFQLKIVIMILLWKSGICSNDYYNNFELSIEDSKSLFEINNILANNVELDFLKYPISRSKRTDIDREESRMLPKLNGDDSLNNSEILLLSNITREDLKSLGKNKSEEIVFDRIIESEQDENETICVGDPDYCNYTKEEYLDMLDRYIFPEPYEWVLIATHAVVFIIGLVGNALVCIAVYRNQSMRTVTNYFIVNLAVADFMVILICLPPTVLWDVTETWFFGTAMCRVVLYFQSVSVTVSVLTLTFISVDRWYAICFPLKFKSTTGRAKTAILIIWLLSLSFNIPEFVVLKVQRKTQLRFDVQYFMQCSSTWSDESDLNWHIIKALFLYTFPLLLMMIAYCQIVRVLWRSDNIPGHTESHKLCTTPSGQTNWLAANRRTVPSIHANASTEGQLRSRRKAAKMLVAVVAMFAVCYFPVHLLSVMRLAYDIQQTSVVTCIALISHVMCYANSAVNPLIYNFMSGKFRREFHRSYFKCFCCCYGNTTPERNGTSFAPIGSSRAGTTRTVVRRNDSCVSYRLTHLSPSNQNSIKGDIKNTSFIEVKKPKLNDSISESGARYTITTNGKD